MNKGLPLAKRVLISWPKIPQMPLNLSAQIVCPSPKVWDFDEKRLHWASVVRGFGCRITRKLQPAITLLYIRAPAAVAPQFKNSLNIIIKAHCAIMLA